MCHFMSLRGPPQVDRGNLNRYILDCFVVKLLAMTAQTQLMPRERLPSLFVRALAAVKIPMWPGSSLAKALGMDHSHK